MKQNCFKTVSKQFQTVLFPCHSNARTVKGKRVVAIKTQLSIVVSELYA